MHARQTVGSDKDEPIIQLRCRLLSPVINVQTMQEQGFSLSQVFKYRRRRERKTQNKDTLIRNLKQRVPCKAEGT